MNSKNMFFGAALLAACAPAPKAHVPAGITVIKETTQGSLGGFRVGVANIWVRDYPLPSGQMRKGMSAQLHLQSSRLIVGQGSEITVGGGSWRVTAVIDGGDEHGAVHLEPSFATE